jgi:hypothetical protein
MKTTSLAVCAVSLSILMVGCGSTSTKSGSNGSMATNVADKTMTKVEGRVERKIDNKVDRFLDKILNRL